MKTEFKAYNNYLYIIVSGEISKSITEQENPEFIKKICDEKGLKKILINANNLSENISTMNYFIHAKEFAKVFSGSNIKISIVDNKENLNSEPFFETAATNRGVNVKIFKDIEKAKRWLFN